MVTRSQRKNVLFEDGHDEVLEAVPLNILSQEEILQASPSHRSMFLRSDTKKKGMAGESGINDPSGSQVVSFDLKRSNNNQLTFSAYPEELKQSEVEAFKAEIKDAIRSSVRHFAYS
jgi:hypothetical protein